MSYRSGTNESSDGITPRERILAALNGLLVDRIPFAPLIDLYTLKQMPAEIMSGIRASYADLEGFRGLVSATRRLGCDVMIRHVPVFRPQPGGSTHFQNQFVPPVEIASELKGNELIEKLDSPAGSLYGIWGFNQLATWIPHPIRFPVTTSRDLDIFDFALNHFSAESPIADEALFLQIDAEIGPDGIATASFPPSPLMFMIEEMCGLESFYFLLQDRQEQMEAVLNKLHQANLRLAAAIAATSAKVIIGYEDTSTTLMSPTIFRKYCQPYLDEYARIFKGTGKVFLVHMCGKLRTLVPDLAAMDCAGFSDISPQPTGDLPLDEAVSRLPGKVVIGGIDPNLFICPDAEMVRQTISALLERLRPYKGVILGSADTMPCGTRMENVHLIRQLVDRF